MSTQTQTSLWTQLKTWREALIWIKTDTSILMNSWRHLDSSTIQTQLLKHRLCLWNAHHPWTRYILFPSLCSLRLGFIPVSQCTTKSPKWNPPQVLLRFVGHELRNCPVHQKTLITEKNIEEEFPLKQHSTNHSYGDLRIVERGCPHMVLGNQCLGTRTKYCFLNSHFVYPIWDCVHSYSILPCQMPFSNMTWAWQWAVQTEVVDCPRTNKNGVHTVTRCPLLCHGILLWVLEKSVCWH